MKDKQDIINTLLACMDYNKKDDTWYIKANRIDNLAKDLESEFNNVVLADVSTRIGGLEPKDHWFESNLRCLLGGQISLIKQGKQKEIDRKSLAEWTQKHL